MPRIIYDSRELCDMILLYGETRGNAHRALRLYGERFPDRRQPANGRVITNAVQRVRDNEPVTGALPPAQGPGAAFNELCARRPRSPFAPASTTTDATLSAPVADDPQRRRCLDKHQDFVYQPELAYCNATFDTFLCWPPTPAGAVASQHCPLARLSDTSRFAFRSCGKSGQWVGRWPGEPSAAGWTNYTPCFPPEVQTLLVQVYDDERDAQLKFEIAERTRHMEIAGFSISLVALIMSLVIFSYYRSLRNNRTRIHKHLFSAMVLQVLIRLTLYIDQARVRGRPADPAAPAAHADLPLGIDNMPYLCETAYVLLEYAITVMFMWMFIEGLHLHNVVTASALRERVSLWFYYAIGWGLPVVFTGVWATMTALHYGQEKVQACWYGYNFTSLYWILQGPRLGVIMINLVFLVNIMRVLIVKLRRTASTELEKVRKAVRAALVLLPLLGITNACGMTRAPLDSAIKFALWSYFTHFLRSFQGFFIALIYCFLNGEVRQVLKKHYFNYMSMRIDNRQNRDSFFNFLSSSGDQKSSKTRIKKSDEVEFAENIPPKRDTKVDNTTVKPDHHTANKKTDEMKLAKNIPPKGSLLEVDQTTVKPDQHSTVGL